jgi:hypothetical protein
MPKEVAGVGAGVAAAIAGTLPFYSSVHLAFQEPLATSITLGKKTVTPLLAESTCRSCRPVPICSPVSTEVGFAILLPLSGFYHTMHPLRYFSSRS